MSSSAPMSPPLVANSSVLSPVPTSPYVGLHRVSPVQHSFVTDLLASTWTTSAGRAPMCLNQAQHALGVSQKSVRKLITAGLLTVLPLPQQPVSHVSADAVDMLASAQVLGSSELAGLGMQTLVIRAGGPVYLGAGAAEPLGRPWWGYNASMPRVMTVASTISTWRVNTWAGPVLSPAQVDPEGMALGLTHAPTLMAALHPSEIARALVAVGGFVVEDVQVHARLVTGQERTAFVGSDLDVQTPSLVGRRLPETTYPGPVLPAALWRGPKV